LLAEDHVTKVDFLFFDLNECFLASADKGNVDSASFTENGEHGVDVLVELGCEGNGDGGGETCTHASRRRVLDVEEILYLVFEGQKFERVEREGDIREQNSLRVTQAHCEILRLKHNKKAAGDLP